MEVRTKLKLIVGLSAIALIFKIIASASPGWVVVKTNVMFNPMDQITPENDGLRVDEVTGLTKPEKQKVSISFGMWYYKVCKCGRDDDYDDSSSSEENTATPDETGDEKRHHRKHHRHHKCYHRCYREHRPKHKDDEVEPPFGEEENDIPLEFRHASEFISTSVDLARHGRHELAWYVSIGLSLGVIGLVAAIVYARGHGLGKHSGRLACSTQVLSAFFFWAAVIRVATYIIQLKKFQEHQVLGEDFMKDVMFGCPWCLIVAAVGAGIMGLVSLFHLIMVSRDRKTEVSEYHFKAQDKIPIISSSGYDHVVIPSMYMHEEAGPLPEKQSIS